MADKGYAGRIANAGAQEIKAPNQNKGKRGKSSVIRGQDLRSGKK